MSVRDGPACIRYSRCICMLTHAQSERLINIAPGIRKCTCAQGATTDTSTIPRALASYYANLFFVCVCDSVQRTRVPHERYARTCTLLACVLMALSLATPSHPYIISWLLVSLCRVLLIQKIRSLLLVYSYMLTRMNCI